MLSVVSAQPGPAWRQGTADTQRNTSQPPPVRLRGLGVDLTLGEIYATQGKFEKAILAFDHARTEAADPIPARLGRAEVLLKIGRSEEAVRDLEEVFAGDPEDETLWLALAHAHEAAGDLGSALDAAQRAPNYLPEPRRPL